MTPDEQKYYETQLDMFVSEGWKHFTAQIQQMRDATDHIKGLGRDELPFKQGELSLMDWVLGWPDQVKRAYEELQNEDEEKADAEASASTA